MAVPAHDERDFEFAKQFGLPIRAVVKPPPDWLKRTKSTLDNLSAAYTEEGEAIHSGPYNDTPTARFKHEITQWLEQKGLGKKRVNFKLRDWLFSRQRYWGEPFPLLHEIGPDDKPTGLIRPLSEEESAAAPPRNGRLQADRFAGRTPLESDGLGQRHDQRQEVSP